MAQTPTPTPTAAERRERNALGAQPWQVIPSGNLTGLASHFSELRPFEITTVRDRLAGRCSLGFFSFIGRAAAQSLAVTSWTITGAPIRPESLHRLNSYLRTACLEKMSLPWHGAQGGSFHRYAFASFCEHLALDFSPPSAAPARVAVLDALALDTMTPDQLDAVSLGLEQSFAASILGPTPALFLFLEDQTQIRLPAGTTAADVFTLAKILSE